MGQFEERVLKTIRKHGMVNPGEHVLVAVSGGADSMALMLYLHHLATPLRLTLTVAHLNHQLRGAESDADEEFIRRTCASLGLPFRSESATVRKEAESSKGNLEEAARKIRYKFLRRTAAQLGATKIAVGHNLNDQAETMLLRLFRGSGPQGLSGIHPIVDGLVIRPLLDCSRHQILRYLERKGVTHREDSTNKDTERRRNRIRLELLPYLAASFNPRIMESLSRTAEFERETADYLARKSEEAFVDLRVKLDDGMALPIKGLSSIHPVLRSLVIRQAVRCCRGTLKGITARHVQDIQILCRPGTSGRRIELPRGIIVGRQFDDLIFRKVPSSATLQFCYELPVPGHCVIEEIGLEFRAGRGELSHGSTLPPSHNLGKAFFDAKLLPSFLVIRSRHSGDRYGGPRHKKVKKMLIDAKIAVQARSELPMIVAGDAVIWIPGFQPARAFKARPGSLDCVVVEVRQRKKQETEMGLSASISCGD